MPCVDGIFGSVVAETVNVADLEVAVAGDKDVLLTTDTDAVVEGEDTESVDWGVDSEVVFRGADG